MLELLNHSAASFITLTYSKEKLPDDKNLRPRDTQLFLKRFRKFIAPLKVRFFLVGEYGGETQRPHYHIILFGFNTCLFGRTNHLSSTCCSQCTLVKNSWAHGGVDLGTVTYDSIAYISGYVLKKMTAKNDFRLNGRHPEFTRMSLRPGIGALAIPQIAENMMKSDFAMEEISRLQGDVPTYLKNGKNSILLGRYLRAKLRKEMGLIDDSERRLEVMSYQNMEMEKKELKEDKNYYKNRLDKMKQKIHNVLNKAKIFESRRSL